MEGLSEAHSRAFNAVAIATEIKLMEMQLSVLKYKLYQPVHIELIDDLSGAQKESIENKIEQVKDLLRSFGLKYGVKFNQECLKKEIVVKATFLSVDLYDYTGNGMNGYGPLDAAIKNDFEEYVQKIIGLVEQIREVCDQAI
jgi:hypothetical protein